MSKRIFETRTLGGWGLWSGLRNPATCRHLRHVEIDRVSAEGPSYIRFCIIFQAPDDDCFYRIYVRVEDRVGGMPPATFPVGATIEGTRVVYRRVRETVDVARWRAFQEPIGLINPMDFTVSPLSQGGGDDT